jgi:hypothetical protein
MNQQQREQALELAMAIPMIAMILKGRGFENMAETVEITAALLRSLAEEPQAKPAAKQKRLTNEQIIEAFCACRAGENYGDWFEAGALWAEENRAKAWGVKL